MSVELPTLEAFNVARADQWWPGVASDEVPHGEIFASDHEAAGAALALALALDRMRCDEPNPLADAPDERAWLWVQDRDAQKRTGRPYRPGLPRALRHRLVHVAAKSAEDALFAIEEGLRCRDLAFVIGEIAGNPRALTFTASRRLSLAAEKHGVPLWLVRIDAARELSSARMRWQVRAAPSPLPRWNAQAPGAASWRAELFRARRHPPGEWILRDEDERLVQFPAPACSKQRLGETPQSAQSKARVEGAWSGWAKPFALQDATSAGLAPSSGRAGLAGV